MSIASKYIRNFRLFHEMGGNIRGEDIRYLEAFLEGAIRVRNDRAQDLASQEVKGAIQIERRLFPLGLPIEMVCVDGRTMLKVMTSLESGVIRVPAGDSKEFLPRSNGKGIFLRSDGRLADRLRRALSGGSARAVVILDSHRHCAARKASSIDKNWGVAVGDDGLHDDVVRKMELARALQDFVDGEFSGSRRLSVLHISFDPHSGFMTVGLELDQALNDARVLRSGYTDETIRLLADEGTVLSVEKWIDGGFLSHIADRFGGRLDYEYRYREDTKRFWDFVEESLEEMLPVAENDILRFYPSLENDPQLLREYAVFLLANALTAHLLDRVYDKHDESMVAVSDGGQGPYRETRSFTVSPSSGPECSAYILFTANLVRANRREGRFSPFEKDIVNQCFGEDSLSHIRTPVPILTYRKLRKEISLEEQASLEDADWADLLTMDWMRISDDSFRQYVQEKIPNVSEETSRSLNLLRRDALELFQPGLPATQDLFSGRLLPVFAIRSDRHEIISLVPFFARGYSER